MKFAPVIRKNSRPMDYISGLQPMDAEPRASSAFSAAALVVALLLPLLFWSVLF